MTGKSYAWLFHNLSQKGLGLIFPNGGLEFFGNMTWFGLAGGRLGKRSLFFLTDYHAPKADHLEMRLICG